MRVSRIDKWVFPVLSVILLVGALWPPSGAFATDDATVSFEAYKAGFMARNCGGHDVLKYKRKFCEPTNGGASAGTAIGVSETELIGEVHDLMSVSDIDAAYAVARAGIAIVGGNRAANL